MSIEPQLAESIEPMLLAELVEDNNVSFEQKIDGERLLVTVENGQVYGTNRNRTLAVDPEISRAVSSLGARFTFDGEMLGGQFHVFDVPQALDLVTIDSPYCERRLALETIKPVLCGYTDKIHVLPSLTTSDDKIELIHWCAQHRTEGIMVKDLTAQYAAGKRSTAWLKAKMVKSCDVFITGLTIDGKRNASVAVYGSDGTEVDVGTVTMTDLRLRTAKVGDVLEVRYLYASDNRKLVQPHVLRFRNDKLASQCLVGQLIFTNKELIFGRDTNEH